MTPDPHVTPAGPYDMRSQAEAARGLRTTECVTLAESAVPPPPQVTREPPDKRGHCVIDSDGPPPQRWRFKHGRLAVYIEYSGLRPPAHPWSKVWIAPWYKA